MNRSSFLRSLVIVAVSPKILAKIDLSPKVSPKQKLFSELNFVIPDYIPALVEKYSTSSFLLTMEAIGKSNHKLQPFTFINNEKQKV